MRQNEVKIIVYGLASKHWSKVQFQEKNHLSNTEDHGAVTQAK